MPSINSNAYVNGNHSAPAPPPQAMQSFGNGAPQGYAFQYSACTGRRKALLIGINYFGQRGQLRGCINDVKNMSAFLNENFGYQRDDMVILTDDQQNPMSQPTKQNILRAMHWVVKPRILTVMKRMVMTKSSTQLISDKLGISWMMRCTGSWYLHYIRVCV